jgi:hypothetical protein
MFLKPADLELYQKQKPEIKKALNVQIESYYRDKAQRLSKASFPPGPGQKIEIPLLPMDHLGGPPTGVRPIDLAYIDEIVRVKFILGRIGVPDALLQLSLDHPFAVGQGATKFTHFVDILRDAIQTQEASCLKRELATSISK